MEAYKKPFIEIVELLKEDAILTSCSADSCAFDNGCEWDEPGA